MIGGPILRDGSRCGIPIGCWRWHCELLLCPSNCVPKVIRFSAPFTPPTKRYNSLEEIVKKVPNYAYQLYFAHSESTKEIEANVRGTVFKDMCIR
jgi:hypothetical protein